jgi:hypothetical protein
MWTTVLLLGLAVSIEPARVGVIALLLTRQQPMRHLLTFIGTGFIISFSVGLLVLFVFHHGFLGPANFNPALVQIGIGVVALLLAALLASNIPLRQFAPGQKAAVPVSGSEDPVEPDVATQETGLKRLTTRARTFLTGDSSWLSGSAGAALAMPSLDYMALLALIIASKASPAMQVTALLTFLALASLAALIPLLGYLFAPAKTTAVVLRFNGWIRTRTRRHAAAFVAALGGILIVVGASSL